MIVIVFLRSNEKRDDQWRAFLSEQRAQTTDALSRLSAEITSVATAVTTVHGEQLRHDAWMRESVDVMKARSAKSNKSLPRTNE